MFNNVFSLYLVYCTYERYFTKQRSARPTMCPTTYIYYLSILFQTISIRMSLNVRVYLKVSIQLEIFHLIDQKTNCTIGSTALMLKTITHEKVITYQTSGNVVVLVPRVVT